MNVSLMTRFSFYGQQKSFIVIARCVYVEYLFNGGAGKPLGQLQNHDKTKQKIILSIYFLTLNEKRHLLLEKYLILQLINIC